MIKLNIRSVVFAILVIGLCDNVHSDGRALHEFCKAQENATDADMKMWASRIEPKPRIVKCLDACVGENMGWMTNNKVNADVVMKLFAARNKGKEEIAKMSEILNECSGETDTDRCEATAKVLKCMYDGGQKRGMKDLF